MAFDRAFAVGLAWRVMALVGTLAALGWLSLAGYRAPTLLVWFAAVDSHFTFRLDENWQPEELGFSIGASWSSAMYQLLDVFVAPLTGTMIALLYLKSRQAGGERLQEADEAVAASGTASQWQRRMQTRSRIAPVSLGEPSAASPAGR